MIREILRFYLTFLDPCLAGTAAISGRSGPMSPRDSRLWNKAKRARAPPIRFYGAWDTSCRAETSRRDAQGDPLLIRSISAKSQ